MVKIEFCDKCHKELSRVRDPTSLGNLEGFENSSFDFGDFNDVWEEAQNGKTITLPNKIIKPRLCQDCITGYNNIINNANKEIKEYLEIKEPKKRIIKKKETPKPKNKFFSWR